MTHEAKRKMKVALSTALLAGATALAGNVTLPNTFTPNTPARAAEVNANFTAVKTAVDDNHGRLQTVEGQLPPLQTSVAGLNTSVTTLNNTTWRRTGNLATNPATDYLGTADNTPLDLRVNAARVMRLSPNQVGINTTNLEQLVELVVGSNDAFANVMLRNNQATQGGFLISVGDANAAGQANFYLDAFRSLSAPTFQLRRLRIDDIGRLSVNRNDNFIAGLGNVPFMVGTDTANGNGAYLTPGGVWTNASSRHFKHALQAVNTASVLEKVVSLKVSTWEYKDSVEGRHMGPMAEDFSAAFALGKDAQRIATVDEGGVALAAIQGLNDKLERENAALHTALSKLERRLSKLER
ncbi:MAG: tail fiber domain-containing protein [Archangium sp.]|nr:tail fiber domain-containing protein [Archangium sp.]MDP3154681.1 tail fiber domain-containing protein [Archangium sp.]MDP3572691.1 tail fiber domain-containing protein [Archangium sp.]